MNDKDDCISRRVAIDVLRGYFDGMLETDTWSPCDVYGLIEILPSVQPEPKWIPCNARLPEEKQPVLVTDGSVFGVCEIIRTDYGLSWRDCIGYWFDFGEWDAWQSLPAPYKGGEKE